jgi:hypothetical protein
MLRRLLVSALVVTGLVAGSFGAAHAATVPPDEWAPTFCTAVVDYQQTISQQSDALASALDTTTGLDAARAQVVTFLGDMVSAAKTAKRQIQQAGSPSTPNGSKIAAKFVQGLDASAKVFARAKAQAAKISTTDVQAFKVQGKKVGTDLSDAGEALGKSFSGIGKLDKGKKLEAAVKAAPECAPIA